jgi:hypothetical protein
MADRFDAEPNDQEPDDFGFFRFAAIYLACLVAVCGAAFAASRFLDWSMFRTMMGLFSVQFAAGALQWPRWNWQMLRRAGWFAVPPGPLRQLVFAVISICCVLMAVMIREVP